MAALFLVLIIAAGMTACRGGGVNFGLQRPAPADPADEPLPEAKGEVIGNGDVRIAMLLPLSAPGNAAVIATELKNAAKMAMDDWGNESLQLVIKDTMGTPAGAVDAASEASAERASLVLGPLFSGSVSAVTGVLQPGGTPIIAYSTDSNVAGPGVYLASFLPQTIIDRTLSFAVSHNYRSIVAILPNGGSGNVAEAQIRTTLARAGGTLVGVARYDYNDGSMAAAIESIIPSLKEAEAIFIPDGGSTPGVIVNVLQRRGVPLGQKKLLGTGQWASSDLSNPALNGAWFADADRSALNAFKTKYALRYSSEPSTVAPLAYDTVALVSGLVKKFGADGLNKRGLESRTGYSGYTGTFRFRSDGTNERGLAVYEVSNGSLNVVSPAPKSFGWAS